MVAQWWKAVFGGKAGINYRNRLSFINCSLRVLLERPNICHFQIVYSGEKAFSCPIACGLSFSKWKRNGGWWGGVGGCRGLLGRGGAELGWHSWLSRLSQFPIPGSDPKGLGACRAAWALLVTLSFAWVGSSGQHLASPSQLCNSDFIWLQ